jgi:serine/threonine-protein kinase HipA
MNETCTIQLHAKNTWHDVATVTLRGESARGFKAKTYSGYSAQWVLDQFGATDAWALCAHWPVGLEALDLNHWPPFLVDMLPQGYGRQELLRRLGEPAVAGASADWKLLLCGAGNPIGNLRVREAAQWLSENTGTQRGFTDEEVAQRSEDFSEFLASHGLFVAGSSGVQGEWPKVLLTRATDGLLYLDHTLADDLAIEHFIVKFGRGSDPQLACILRQEAPYMQIAKRLGLRVHAPLTLRNRALFIPRFDRVIRNGSVIRLAQESIATFTGTLGLDGTVPSHDQVCKELLRHCTNPQAEVLEYLKRDVANLAFGNKDNHGRNTAIKRDFNGEIVLAPVYDFAPMYLHPDAIARRIRWEQNDNGQPDWNRVLDRVSELSEEVAGEQTERPVLDRQVLAAGLKAMAPVLSEIATHGEQMGLEPAVLDYLRPGLLARINDLEKLH